MTASSSPRSRSQCRLWLGLGGGALVVCLALLAGVVALYLYRRPPASAGMVVEYVLDASPRMDLPGESGAARLAIVRGVLAEVFRPADPALLSGLRVFGVGAVTQACQDTNLLVPLAPSSQKSISDKASTLEPGQSTDSAMSQAIVAAIRDLASKDGSHSLVVVTGGADSCDPNSSHLVAQEAQRSGIDLETYVIGFGVSDAEAEALKVTLSQVPKARFLNAKDEAALRATLLGVQDRIMHPASAYAPGSTLVSDKDAMRLLYVPAGDFLMGASAADPAGAPSEKPQRTVYLDDYWIDQTDVTNAMYATCVQAGACRPPSATNSDTHASYYGHADFNQYPAMNITWSDAQAYCWWAGRRLPTEAEWEKAARGTDGRLYPWGNQVPDLTRANYNNAVGDVTEVGHYPAGASPYGALDMAGNISNWTADWYDANYYSHAPARNPTGPASGPGRVLRGGSWAYAALQVRAAFRSYYVPDKYGNIGFRCVR